MLDLILGAGLVVQAILVLLALLSVASWAIIVFKSREFSAAERATEEFLRAYLSAPLAAARDAAHKYPASPLSGVFQSGYRELQRLRGGRTPSDEGPAEQIEIVVQQLGWIQTDEVHRLERGLPFLATVGGSAPFIGLFGTVWGIMNSFLDIGTSGSPSIAVVAPGIAGALVATAVGLAAAIPAVVAYNYASARLGRLQERTDAFRAEYSERLRRLAVRAA